MYFVSINIYITLKKLLSAIVTGNKMSTLEFVYSLFILSNQ